MSKIILVDTRDVATRKRVNQAFDEQWSQIQARALQSHEPGCDPWICSKSVCFKHVGDKIVSKPTIEKAGGSKKLSKWANDNRKELTAFWAKQDKMERVDNSPLIEGGALLYILKEAVERKTEKV